MKNLKKIFQNILIYFDDGETIFLSSKNYFLYHVLNLENTTFSQFSKLKTQKYYLKRKKNQKKKI